MFLFRGTVRPRCSTRQDDVEDSHPSYWPLLGQASFQQPLHFLGIYIKRDLGFAQAKVHHEVASGLVQHARKALVVDSLVVQVLEDGIAGHG